MPAAFSGKRAGLARKLLWSGMAMRFVSIDRDTPLLLPVDLREWVPANHLAHVILDALETVDERACKVNVRGTGDAQYPPIMRLGLLVYS